jgi:hypothetical protein
VTRRLLVVFALLSAGADLAHAQIIQSVRRSQPLIWTSLSIGWLQTQGLCDQATSACWDFGGAPQWRASLELPMGRGSAFGVTGTTARVPLQYSGSAVGPNTCLQCDADANVSQILAHLHLAGGVGFHQVIDIAAGQTWFSNFRQTDGTKLGGGSMVKDFSFAIGYGFGYGLSERTQIMLVQDYGLIIHKRQSGSSDNTAQQSNLRFGVRMGLGERRGR